MLLISLINNTWTRVKHWEEVSAQRRQLKDISDQLLKDIGLSRVDAEREASRPFWDDSADRDVSLRKRCGSIDKKAAECCANKCCSQS